jgi:hypothetical protein
MASSPGGGTVADCAHDAQGIHRSLSPLGIANLAAKPPWHPIRSQYHEFCVLLDARWQGDVSGEERRGNVYL